MSSEDRHKESSPADTHKGEQSVIVLSEPYYYNDLKDFGWSSIATSILLAGAAYPNVLGAGGLFIALLTEGVPPDIDFITVVPGFAFFAATVGFLWCGMVSIVTLPVLHLILWSMKLRIGLVKLGAFAGGLIGFVAVLPATVSIAAQLGSPYVNDALLALLVGPGLATVIGQLGGARGGQVAKWRVDAKMDSRCRLAKLGRLRPRRIAKNHEGVEFDEFDADVDIPQFRFRIYHLLWLGVWLSLLMTLIRLSRIPFERLLPMLLVWLVFQAATLSLGIWLLPRVLAIWRSWRERQTRST
jgi:hypothetical protein